MREYIDQLKSGEQELTVPTSSFEWDTYKYILTAFVRRYCNKNERYFDEDIHNDIMDMFGDDLFEIYEKNK